MEQSWSVFQIGAREHYAVARSLLAQGISTRLVTDIWSDGPLRRWMPAGMRERFHSEIPRRNVRSFNVPMLAFEAATRLRGVHGWERVEGRNRRFGGLAARVPAGDVVFSYSYAALEIFRANRGRSRLVLGQIDPGPFEQELVEELHERHGLARPTPPSNDYWERWREECELADVVVANSNWSREALVRSGIEPEKIQVVPLAYEKRRGPQRKRDIPGRFTAERPLKVLFLGQAIVRKGILELLEAARRLRGVPVKWIIVGGIPDARVKELAGKSGVELVGPVPRSQAEEYYSDADVFILPTHSDGFALTQLEAAASGLPLIVSTYCGEVVRDGIDGLVLRSVTPESISEAIEAFLCQPGRLASLASARPDLSPFTLQRVGEQLRQVFSAAPASRVTDV